MNHLCNRKRYGAAVLIAALLLLITMTAAGCNSESAKGKDAINKGQLKAGYIDSDKLLANYEPYRQFLPDKEKHALKVRELLTPGKKLTKEQEKYIKQTTLSFMKREEKILGQFVQQVRAASEKVATEKKLDIIINNPDSGQVLEFGGIDVTSEVQAKLSQKTDKPDPENKNG